MTQKKMVHICVLGAGAMGLSSALNIKQTFPDVPVTIVADKFFEHTTSYGAGGFFRPHLSQIPANKEVAQQWIEDSWHHYDALAKSPEAKVTGMMHAPGLVVYQSNQDEAYVPLKKLVYDFHSLTPEELKKRNLNYKYGYAFTTIISMPPMYMRWMTKKFLQAGGQIKKRTVENLTELKDEFDVVINCCGLNAYKLVKAENVYPVKGQLVHVKAPWIQYFFLSDDDVYFIPWTDRLMIGGIRDKGNFDNTVDPKISKQILSKAEKLFPALKGAEIIKEWSGLRPCSDRIRLEVETLNCGPKGHLKVIHNYGHGGHGITLSWGCSMHVVRLLRELLGRPKSAL